MHQLLSEYGDLQQSFEALGGYTYEQEILKVVTGLGLTPADLERPAAELSGGEKSKLLLACKILEKPDLLLLDEPTNHLDTASIEWLEQYLQTYPGTFLTVSHDRYFLQQIADEIWELERGTLTVYSGSYNQYVEEKERRQKHLWLEYEKQQRAIKNLTQQSHDQRINAYHSEKAGGDARAAKVMKKALVAEAKREKLLTSLRVEKPFEEMQIRIQFPALPDYRGPVLTVKELTMAYGELPPLFQNLNFTLAAGERLGISGPNGAGKTTLIKLLLGELTPISGEIIRSGRVKTAYYSQEQDTLDASLSALENILALCPVDETTARTMLGVLRIEKAKVQIPVQSLSGGERGKVQLCRILLSGASLLILDEPTNHLDIDCCEAIESALQNFPGSVIFISHDRYFMQKLASQILYLNGLETQMFYGDYTSFRNNLAHNS